MPAHIITSDAHPVNHTCNGGITLRMVRIIASITKKSTGNRVELGDPNGSNGVGNGDCVVDIGY